MTVKMIKLHFPMKIPLRIAFKFRLSRKLEQLLFSIFEKGNVLRANILYDYVIPSGK